MQKRNNQQLKGQSLTEILVALAIGVAFINVGILAMATSNIVAKVNRANNYALTLLKSQRSAIETIADNDWHSIADLTIGKHYKLAKQNNSLIIQPGEEKVFDEKPPVAQWSFDEGTGTLAYDNMGTNNGTLVNTPTWTTSSSCVSGSCLSLTGNNEYVTINDDFPETSFAFGMQNDSSVYNLYVYYIDSWSAGYNSGIVAYHNWGMYTVVLDGVNDKVRIYSNGIKVGEYTKTGTVDRTFNIWAYANSTTLTNHSRFFNRNSATDFRIGTYSDTTSTWNGLIDEPSIYDYALTDSQIKQHYNAGLNRLGLVSQWGMDEGSGIKAYDSQGTNDGTLTSGPTWQTDSNCVSGGCLSFSRTNSQYITLPPAIGDISNFGGINGSVTIGAWIKVTDISVWNGIIQRSGGIDYFATEPGGYLICMVHDAVNNVNFWPTSNTAVKPNIWTYVVFEFTGSSGFKFFVNGILDSGVVNSNLQLFNYGSNQLIGVTEGSYFNGSIDDVRIYNRALSADEIANQYKDGYTKYFYVNNVSRDIASDPTASTHDLELVYNTNHDDPNTKKIVNVTRYLLGTPGRVNTQEQYLTRAFNINSLIQTDWSGNSGVTGPEIDFGNNYYSSSNLTLSAASQMSLTSTASSGTLTSTIIDTQSINGSGYFNLLWQGDSLCTGCSVKFQIAASNSSSGPWTYYGPTATSDYYIPSGPGIPVPITYAGQYSALSASVQNKRYIRYQITLVPAINTSPVVTSAIINYAQ